MSDLYWERLYAGHYETIYFVNGYKYKVVGEGTEWNCYYKYKSPNSKKVSDWRPLRYGYSDRMKQAKNLCRMHNENPRTKYKVVGREDKRIFKDGKFKMVPHIIFREATLRNGEWVIAGYGGRRYMLPDFYESYSGEVSLLPDDYLDYKEAVNVLTMENRSA